MTPGPRPGAPFDATPRPEPSFWLEHLDRHARERPVRPALTRRLADGSWRETSFAALYERVAAFAALLRALTEPGELVPLCLARGEDCAAAMLAALATGRAFCCVHAKLRVPQVEHIAVTTAARFALIDESGLMALRGGFGADSPLMRVRFQFVGDRPPSRAAAKVGDRLGAVTPMPHAPAGPLRAEPSADERALGCCLFTSGSTGSAKGVLVSRGDLAARAQVEAMWYGLTPEDRLLNLLPFSFDVGLNQLLSAVVSGAELVVGESWLPLDVLGVVAARRITGISAVPSIWADFMRDGRAFDRAGPHRSLRYLTVSGGDLTASQHGTLLSIADGAQIFKTYGQTEAFRATSLRPEEYAARPRSVGRPFPGVHLYVLRDDGTEAAPGELGQVVHAGLGTMLGYLAPDDASAKLRALHGRRPEAPHHLAVFTGDVGYLDAEGYLFLTGRRDDMLKIHGHRVYPAEVASLLTTLPGVAAAEVVALRTESIAKLVAFLVPHADHVLPGPQDLRRTFAQLAPSYMIPEHLVVLAELPRTPSGKPDRTRLLEEACVAFRPDEPCDATSRLSRAAE